MAGISRGEEEAGEAEEEQVHIFTDATWKTKETCVAGVAIHHNVKILS